jgi:hypothetical protein
MKTFIKSLLIFSVYALHVIGVEVDPADGLLIAYRLTAEQKAAFSATDGVVSPFWDSDWADRDFIDMNTVDNSYPGRDMWDGEGDARITVKAAADAEGLYLYLLVEDNVFVDPIEPTSPNVWMYDACDVYIDLLSSTEIGEGAPDILAMPDFRRALTFTTLQMIVFMGAAEIPTSIGYRMYDQVFFGWTNFNVIPFAEIPQFFIGMQIEVMRVDQTKKAQEWFIPWNYMGGGIGYKGPLANKKFAFTAGYNDMDGDAGTVNSLRWKTYDPYAITPESEGLAIDERALNSWGDIIMAEDMPDAEGVSVKRPAFNRSLKHGTVMKTELYNLKGERVLSKSAVMKNSILIERSILSNGKTVSRTIASHR